MDRRSISGTSSTWQTAAASSRAPMPTWMLSRRSGRLSDLLPNESIDSPYYVSVLVGDDPSETDARPLEDGQAAGAGILVLRAESFGPRGVHMSVEMTVARPAAGQPGLRVLSWREVR
jgi:hypothetical protein